jgi:hypothetical protein
MSSDLSEEDFRRLYLDWCSSRVAKRFLELSLDEVWFRSNEAASSPSPDPPSHSAESPSGIAVERIPDYLEVVRKTALILAEEMQLPNFADWKIAYLEDPAAFAKDIVRR